MDFSGRIFTKLLLVTQYTTPISVWKTPVLSRHCVCDVMLTFLYNS